MSDQEMTPESQAPGGGVSQDIGDELAALRVEAQSMARAASRSWKITAVMFIVVLVVVATYLGVLRSVLAEQLQAEAIVELGVKRVDTMLARYGAPGLTSGQLPEWAATELKEQAPSIVEQYVRPELERLPEQLPQLRQQLVERFRENSEVYVDKATDWLIQNGIPAARSRLVAEAKQGVAQAMEGLDEQLEALVAEVIAEHKANISELAEADWPGLRRRMEQEFEREFGPVLDEMFAGIEEGIQSTRQQMADLLAAYQSGQLTYEQKLEIQLIRLVDALMASKALEAEVQPESPLKRAGEHLIEEAAELEEAAPAAPPVTGPDLSKMPEEARKRAREALQKGREAAQEAEEEAE